MHQRFSSLTRGCGLAQALPSCVRGFAMFLLIASCQLVVATPQASGQEPPEREGKTFPESSSSDVEDSPEVAKLEQEFDAAAVVLKEKIKSLRRLGLKFYEANSLEANDVREEWDAEAIATQRAHVAVQQAALAYFLAAPEPNIQATEIVYSFHAGLIDAGQIGACYRATKKLIKIRPGDEKITLTMGQVSILANDFDAAAAYVAGNQLKIAEFPIPSGPLYQFLDSLQKKYERELKFQAEDAKQGSLPRAIIETNKGQIVIELFENQAPQTVANFVSLAQAGFYDQVMFHHVIKNVIAHTGIMTARGAKQLRYTIYDESHLPAARHHFRGSVSMHLNSPKKNQGTSEFRIMLVPGPPMDGTNTVFGRVISGMDVADRLQPTFEFTDEGEEFIQGTFPDTIKSITLVGLRDHEYKPTPVQQEKPLEK
ncbi:MAG: cyclophilin family peptidyl-prolyl cis-trans isomerase [Mariniblastus sp.]|jgi:cyclophilin family peptidyl-prolyl cis-trans isomerase